MTLFYNIRKRLSMSFEEARPRLAEVFLQYQEGDAQSVYFLIVTKKAPRNPGRVQALERWRSAIGLCHFDILRFLRWHDPDQV